MNGQMTNYIMPTSMDVPPIRVFFEEIPSGRGPAGAKGIGELPLDGTAPAIANACDGCGHSPNSDHAGSAARDLGEDSCMTLPAKSACIVG